VRTAFWDEYHVSSRAFDFGVLTAQYAKACNDNIYSLAATIILASILRLGQAADIESGDLARAIYTDNLRRFLPRHSF
jgi:hypothetical protein